MATTSAIITNLQLSTNTNTPRCLFVMNNIFLHTLGNHVSWTGKSLCLLSKMFNFSITDSFSEQTQAFASSTNMASYYVKENVIHYK